MITKPLFYLPGSLFKFSARSQILEWTGTATPPSPHIHPPHFPVSFQAFINPSCVNKGAPSEPIVDFSVHHQRYLRS